MNDDVDSDDEKIFSLHTFSKRALSLFLNFHTIDTMASAATMMFRTAARRSFAQASRIHLTSAAPSMGAIRLSSYFTAGEFSLVLVWILISAMQTT